MPQFPTMLKSPDLILGLSSNGIVARTGANTYAALSTPLATLYGGTGFTSYASGDLLYGNGGGTLSKLAEPGLPGYVLSAVGGVPAWVQLSTLTATTITGTANQVLANGTSGSGQTGPVTLTLPQDINSTSAPTFAGLTTTTNNISHTVGANGFLDLTDGTIMLRAQIGAEAALGTVGAHDLIFRTSNTERARFSASGALSISGSLTISGVTSLKNADFLEFGGSDVLYGDGTDTVLRSGTRIRLRVGASTECLIVDATTATFIGTIQTASPSGSPAQAWLLGSAASVTPTSPNRTIAISVAGTMYYLAAKTTND